MAQASPDTPNPSEPAIEPARDPAQSAATVAAQRTAPATPPVKAGRPPLWLIAVTLAIPLTIGAVWWSNWMGRTLNGAEISQILSASKPSDHYHALNQFVEQAARLANVPKNEGEWTAWRDDLAGCVENVLSFCSRDSELEQVSEASARALGRFAGLAQADPAIFGKYREPARSRLIDMMIAANPGKPVVRYQAACALALYGEHRSDVVDSLRQMLTESDREYRMNAALALRFVGDRTVSEDLRQRSVSDPDPQVREFARIAYEASAGRDAPIPATTLP